MNSIRFAKPRSARTSPDVREAKISPPVPKPTEFAFINNDNPEKIKDPKTRRTVRRHVMKDIGMARRRGGVASPRPKPAHPPSPTFPSFAPFLDSWDEAEASSNVASIYLTLDILDDAVIRLCRTNSALNFLKQEPRQVSKLAVELRDSLTVYTMSLTSVRETLSQGQTLSESASDEMLGTIVCLAFFDMQNLDFHQWKIHMDGMVKILQDQGGFARLKLLNELHQSLFWSDVLGCLIIDTVPRIPLPNSIAISHMCRPASPSFDDSFCHTLSQRFPQVSDVLVPLRSVSECSYAASLPTTPTAEGAGWCKWAIQFANAAYEVLVLPRMRDFRSFTPPPEEGDGQEELREAIRLTIISWLLMVARNTAADDMYDAQFLRGRVVGLMSSLQRIDWSGIEELRLWILVVSALDEQGEAREVLAEEIRQVSGCLALTTWDQIVQMVGKVAWMGAKFSRLSAKLEQDVFFDPSLTLDEL